MDRFSLPDIARFFTVPFVLLSCFLLVIAKSPDGALQLIAKADGGAAALLTLAGVAAGQLIYGIYRAIFYRPLMWIHDRVRPAAGYRNLIVERYGWRKGAFASSIRADAIARVVFEKIEPTDRHRHASSTAHMFYQSFLVLGAFLAAALSVHQFANSWILGTAATLSYVCGFIINYDVEYPETILLKSHLKALDRAMSEVSALPPAQPIAGNPREVVEMAGSGIASRPGRTAKASRSRG